MKISDFTKTHDYATSATSGKLVDITMSDERLKFSFDVAGKRYNTSISLKTEKSRNYAGLIISKMARIARVPNDADLTSLIGYEYPLKIHDKGLFYDVELFPRAQQDAVTTEQSDDSVPF